MGLSLQDSSEHGKKPRLFFVCADGGSSAAGVGTGTRAFGAEVEEVGALGEQLHCVGHGRVCVEERTSIAEGVGCDVDDAHDEGATAELEGAGAQLPGGESAVRDGFA